MALLVKYLLAISGDTRDVGSIPGLGRSPGVGNGTPLQYSCQENSMGRGAWQAIVHGVAKNWTRLSEQSGKKSDILDLIYKIQISYFMCTTVTSFNVLRNLHEYSETISVLTKNRAKVTKPTSAYSIPTGNSVRTPRNSAVCFIDYNDLLRVEKRHASSDTFLLIVLSEYTVLCPRAKLIIMMPPEDG